MNDTKQTDIDGLVKMIEQVMYYQRKMGNEFYHHRFPTISPKPPKFSPQDKYGHYRREQKKPELKEKGLY